MKIIRKYAIKTKERRNRKKRKRKTPKNYIYLKNVKTDKEQIKNEMEKERRGIKRGN